MRRSVPLSAWVALAVLLASAAVLVAVVSTPEEAGAAFPGKNGRIAFVSDRDGDAEIYTIRPDGRGLRQITHNAARDTGPAWSPDGTKMAFASNRDGNDSEIYVKHLKGGLITQLTDNHINPDFNGGSPIGDAGPAWSPDGTQIAFISNRNASDDLECECIQLHVMDADGSDQRSISADYHAQESAPAWSPDGTQIAFHRGTEGLFDIWVTTPDGSSKTVLTNTPGLEDWRTIETYPDWSPDGQRIVYSKAEDFYYVDQTDLWKMDSDGLSKRQLTASAQLQERYPVWSPNGRKIAFVGTSYAEVRSSDIYKMGAEGANPKNITNTPTEQEYDLDWKAAPTTTAAP